MKTFPYVIEAIAFFSCAATYTLHTIENEFIYQVVSERHNYTTNHSVDYCFGNRTDSEKVQSVTDDASKWTMYTSVARYISAAVSALVITAWSEGIGRKYALAFPLVGNVMATAFNAIIIYNRLPLHFMVLSSLICGSFGGYAALIDIGCAYLSDTVRRENRGKRYTVLEASSSVGGGIVLVGTGYWIKIAGFPPSTFFILGCSVISLALLPFLDATKASTEVDDDGRYDSAMCEEVSKNGGRQASEMNEKKTSTIWSQIKVLWRIYTADITVCDACQDRKPGEICSHEDKKRRGRLWRLWFYVLAYSFYVFVMNGIDVFQTMFFLSYPVCFSPVLVGAQNGLDACIIIFSPLLVMVYQMVLQLDNQTILLTSIFARTSTSVLMYFASGVPLVFIATSLGIFSTITTPFIRLQISSLVSIYEQGPALALLSGACGILNTVSPVVFLRIYPATLHISFGFTWLITAAILCIPLLLMIFVLVANKHRK